jgi:hypothetical protein
MAIHLQCGDDCLDPRIRRTRQMLRDAVSALHEKAFEVISIQGIAEHPPLTRRRSTATAATALVEVFVSQRFNELLKARRTQKQTSFSSEVRCLILAACDFFTQRTGGCSKHQRLFEPFVQSAIQKRLKQVLFEDSQKHSPDINVSLAAATSSGTIYDAVIHWIQAGFAENRKLLPTRLRTRCALYRRYVRACRTTRHRNENGLIARHSLTEHDTEEGQNELRRVVISLGLWRVRDCKVVVTGDR